MEIPGYLGEVCCVVCRVRERVGGGGEQLEALHQGGSEHEHLQGGVYEVLSYPGGQNTEKSWWTKSYVILVDKTLSILVDNTPS